MSSFLSNKYLQLRGISRKTAKPITTDTYCNACGYNLRGLCSGTVCPECGAPTEWRSTGRDPLMGDNPASRWHMRIGLALLVFALVVASLARLGMFGIAIAGISQFDSAYLWTGLGLSIAWTVGTWQVTASHLHAYYPNLLWLRRTARITQSLWIPAYALWIASLLFLSGTPKGDTMHGWSVVLRVFAGVGTIFLAIWLIRLAVDAELERAADRINLSIWMLPIPTVLLLASPSQFAWIAAFLYGMVLLVWCWFLVLWARAILTMQRHVSWGARIATTRPHKLERIAQKRAEIDQQVAATVRAVPQSAVREVLVRPPAQSCFDAVPPSPTTTHNPLKSDVKRIRP